MRALLLLAFACFVLPRIATAQPNPLAGTGFAPIPVGAVQAALTPFVTLPPDEATAPLARVQYVTAAPGTDALFINDLSGMIYRTNAAGSPPTQFLDMAAQNVGLRTGNPWDAQFPGLMSIAFHPNFDGDPSKPGYGVFYTASWVTDNGTPPTIAGVPQTGEMMAVREWTTTDPNAPTFSGTSREVLRLASNSAHGIGMIAFNPTAAAGSADYGNLYISLGNGDYPDPTLSAQNLSNTNGKILRINPLAGANGAPYTIPADNPFVGQAGDVAEIWAYGFRQPQSFGWDPLTGTMYINDIGQANVEEVDVGVAGGNYGWPLREGRFATFLAYPGTDPTEALFPLPPNDAANGLQYPIAAYDHTQGNSIGSGFLYRGDAIPALDGDYVLQDIVSGNIYYFNPADAPPGGMAPLQSLQLFSDGAPIDLRSAFGYDSSFVSPRVDARLSEDANGNLLLAMKATGSVFALTAEPIPEPASLACLAAGLAALAGFKRRG